MNNDMEAILITNGDLSNYYLTKNGSVVCFDGWVCYFKKCVGDIERDGTLVSYKGKKHVSGHHLEKNSDYDIIGACYWLPNRIKHIKCNIKIGQEFIYNGNNSRTTNGNTYKVIGFHLFEDGSFLIDYFNDRGHLSSVSDLNDIIITESE